MVIFINVVENYVVGIDFELGEVGCISCRICGRSGNGIAGESFVIIPALEGVAGLGGICYCRINSIFELACSGFNYSIAVFEGKGDILLLILCNCLEAVIGHLCGKRSDFALNAVDYLEILPAGKLIAVCRNYFGKSGNGIVVFNAVLGHFCALCK